MKIPAQPIKTAFILGAGLGTRLRPLTNSCPKPLLRIGGPPIITYAMNHLISAGIERFIVNTHHCADAYHQVFPDHQWRGIPIIFRYEPVLLDTAGGVKNIEDLLEQDDAIFVYNGDIISDIPLKPLIGTYRARKKEVTLALRSNGIPLNVNINDRGDVCDLRHILGNSGSKSCLFTGIYILEKTFLRRMQEGRIESVIPVFIDMIRKKPGSVAGVLIDEGKWHDIGSIDEYEKVNTAFLQSSARNIIRKSTAKKERGEILLFLRQSLDIESSAPIRMTLIAGGGSNRSFRRVYYGNGRSAIFMHYDMSRKENTCYAPIAEFLRKTGVTVPKIIANDPARGFILMEDIGDTDLGSFRNHPWKTRQDYYRKTLEIIHRLHSFPVEHALLKKLTLMEGFGPELYRWEQDYFLDNFVSGVAKIKISPSDREALEEELKGLADSLEKLKPCLIHRDFQSRNVMMNRGKPVLIDFQGMRTGNYFYDLGSLLYDPYISLTEDERTALLKYYFGLLIHDGTQRPKKETVQGNEIAKQNKKLRHPISDDWILFQKMFHEASAERIMQALGAYGFLGLKCGMTEFLLHIPNGLSNLIDAAGHAKILPLLGQLAQQCQHVIKHGGKSAHTG